MQLSLPRNPWARGALIAAIALLLLVVLLLAAAALVLRSTWAEQRIERHVSERLERPVHMRGIEPRLGFLSRVHIDELRIPTLSGRTRSTSSMRARSRCASGCGPSSEGAASS